MSDPDSVVMAQLEIQGCSAELYLNAVPLIRLHPEVTMFGENVAVQQWLTRGDNRLELLVEPGATPSVARSELRTVDRREMKAVARLLRFKDGADGTAESGTLLAEASFEWDLTQPPRMTLPHSVVATSTFGSSFGPWAWESLPVLTLDAALVDEACEILGELDTAVRGKHADRVWQLTELQMRDAAKAYPGLNEEFLRADIDDMLRTFAEEGDPICPRDRSEHDFRLVAGGRLLQLVDKDFRPSFRLKDRKRGQIVPFPTYLGRVGGTLRIVR
jgi:hypothetical protein